jgi:hypothetical protein
VIIISQFDITIFKGDTEHARLFSDSFFIECYNVRFSLIDSSMHLSVFNVGHMLITCSIMNCCTGQNCLHCTMWNEHKNVDKFCTHALQIIEVWVKRLHKDNALH